MLNINLLTNILKRFGYLLIILFLIVTLGVIYLVNSINTKTIAEESKDSLSSEVNPKEIYVDGSIKNYIRQNGSQKFPFSSISTAVESVTREGTVIIAKGLYDENIIISKPLTLIGAKGSVSAWDRNNESEETVIKPQSSEETIKIDSSNVKIDGISLYDAYTSIRVTKDAENITIVNTIIKNAEEGINLWRAKNARVENNVIIGVVGSGITGGDDRATSDFTDDLPTYAQILHNKISQTTLGITGYHENSVIKDNEISNPGSCGTVGAYGISGQLINTQITGNIVRNYALECSAAISLGGYVNRPDSQNVKIEKNTIEGNVIGIRGFTENLSAKNTNMFVRNRSNFVILK